ncbi:carboxypeptidase-like regulatory domain-containing protein [Leifsonia shinshuensis]|uniref:carboxypeptidase-like regulatory domain-containing protein n=1 Tax=Leifsonia shinshuensis TaxID=150026 RepID=UPI001F5064CC|nr:carboxypeptidase-like regulatory domain-containing protein [Leifsonia shinshuensis]MCI0159352.1 carboxypeptidase-like regulatory domain-containing protein [Leifsonia shinshuensis]
MTHESSNPPSDEQPERAGLQRRTIVGAAAWAGPAIVLSTSSPASAASRVPGTLFWTVPSMRTEGVAEITLRGGIKPGDGGSLPSELLFQYTEAVTGPARMSVTGASFELAIRSMVTDSEVSSTVTVTADQYTAAEWTCFVLPPAVGRIELLTSPDAIQQGQTGTATGTVTPPPGAARPATVSLRSSATGVATVPPTVTVAADGTFSIPVKAVASQGTSTIAVEASGYDSVSFAVEAINKVGAGQLFQLTPMWKFHTADGRTAIDAVDFDPRERVIYESGLVVDTFWGSVFPNVLNCTMSTDFRLEPTPPDDSSFQPPNMDAQYRLTIANGNNPKRLVWHESGNVVESLSKTARADADTGEARDPFPKIRRTGLTEKGNGGWVTFQFFFPDHLNYQANLFVEI